MNTQININKEHLAKVIVAKIEKALNGIPDTYQVAPMCTTCKPPTKQDKHNLEIY